MRWLWDPRVAIGIGTVLLLGSAITIGLNWPPSRASIRPAAVGAVLILRGLALPIIRRRLHRWSANQAAPDRHSDLVNTRPARTRTERRTPRPP